MFTMKRDIRNLQHNIERIDKLEKRIEDIEHHNRVLYAFKDTGNFPFRFDFKETTLHKIVMALLKHLNLKIEYTKPIGEDIKLSREGKDK